MKPSTSITMFENDFLMMLTWCFVGFSSRLLKIFTRIVTYFLAGISLASALCECQSIDRNGSSFQLDYRLTSSDIPSNRQSSHTVAESDQLIRRKIYLFISFLCTFQAFRSSYCIKAYVRHRVGWKRLKELRFTCESMEWNFMRKCNKTITELDGMVEVIID